MKLSELKAGDRALILHVGGRGAFRKRILEMGFVSGQVIDVIQEAPLHDPIYYRIMDYNVSLRRQEGDLITVEQLDPSVDPPMDREPSLSLGEQLQMHRLTSTRVGGAATRSIRTIRVALIGNPNSGKTTLFNLASGAHERVGNYSGVTVEAKGAHFDHKGVRFEIIDLPGSYSLSPYSPEELYIRDYLTQAETRPDVVIDVVDATNIERQLYLTVQVKEMGIPMVVALNMWDEFEQKGDQLDIQQLSDLLGTRFVPTVARRGLGISELFDSLLQVVDNDPYSDRRQLYVNYGVDVEQSIETLQEKVKNILTLPGYLPARYVVLKLLEGDTALWSIVDSQPRGAFIRSAIQYEQQGLQKQLEDEELESFIINQRYGFISGALRETFRPNKRRTKTRTDRLDNLLLHPIWGYPIFLFFIFLMFQATFKLGAYPMEWIESLVNFMGEWIYGLLPSGAVRDLLVNGVISGVGGVLVFLPNIIILYLFISLMEDTGYMARATFLMDRVMHGMGLHGKSFIPLIMGFGCNVPAIMGARTIESRQSRLITILVTPLMSCSARLPVYILIAGIFFPAHAGLVLLGLYGLGILLAFVLALLFRKILFKEEDLPFVMELPPYRIPTMRAVSIHMWDKAREYLQKMGSVILFASILIWALGYYPREAIEQKLSTDIARVEQSVANPEEQVAQIQSLTRQSHMEQQRTSYLGRIGEAVQPILAPLGFDWKLSVALVSGLPAKEVVVSTLSVIYTGQEYDESENASFSVGTSALSHQMLSEVDPDTGGQRYTPLTALVFLIFVLIYMPCVATIVAIARESHRFYWGLFSVIYPCLLAWGVAYLARLVGLAFGG